MSEPSEVLWFQRVCRAYACVPITLGSTIALTGGTGLDLVFRLDLGQLDPSFHPMGLQIQNPLEL